MKALTLWQPWAWAIAAGHKKVENRGFAPKFMIGERFAIHAGKTYDPAVLVEICREFAIEMPNKMVTSAIVAVATLEEIVTRSNDPWFVGPYGLVLRDVVAINPPVPCKGAQGFWEIPPDVLAQVERIHEAALT